MLSQEVSKLEQKNRELQEQLNILQERYNDTSELPKRCEYCKNFIQHYIKCGSSYVKTFDGHCIAGRAGKNRKADQTCKYYIERKYDI